MPPQLFWYEAMKTESKNSRNRLVFDAPKGVIVFLAIIVCCVVTLAGYPNVVWPICLMVSAVYGVPGFLKYFAKESR